MDLLALGLGQFGVLVGVGLLAGVLGGLLGIGGGIVMIPAMALLLGDTYGQNSFHVYKLAAIMTAVALSVPAIARHVRAGAINFRMHCGIVPGALLGVGFGVALSSTFLNEHTPTLRRLFGAFLQLVVLVHVYQELIARQGRDHLCRSCPLPSRWALIGSVVGLPAGVIGGLLGVGGGIWAVPVQRLALGIRIRNAIANSSVMVLSVAVATSALLTWVLGSADRRQWLPGVAWQLTACLVPGALIGAWLGAGLVHRFPVRWLRWAFLAILTVAGWRLILT